MRTPINTFQSGAYSKLQEWSRRNCPFTVKTTEEVWDGDWRTDTIFKKPNIPAGTELIVTNVFFNFEGNWAECKYNGNSYSIDLSKVERV